MMKYESDTHSDHNFDNFLRKQLQESQPYLPDDIFTAQVMAKLPTAKKLSHWQERLIILIPFLIISSVVVSQFPVLALLIKAWNLLLVADVSTFLNMGLLMAVSVISGASYWFAKQFKFI